MKKILLIALLGVFFNASMVSYAGAIDFKSADTEDNSDNPFTTKVCNGMTSSYKSSVCKTNRKPLKWHGTGFKKSGGSGSSSKK